MNMNYSDIYKKGVAIKISYKQHINLIILLFLLSFIHKITLMLFLVSLLSLVYRGVSGAVKGILLITTRTFITTSLAVSIDSLQSLKWIVMFSLAGYIIININMMPQHNLRKLKKVLTPLIVFVIYHFFIALIISSVPLVTMFKLISYSVIFSSVVIGVGITSEKIDWIKWTYNLFKMLFIGSMMSLPFRQISYRTNGWGFEGILGHPNAFGIVMVMFIGIACAYYNNIFSKERKSVIAYILLTLGVIYLSRSRTSLLSATLVLMLFIIGCKESWDKKIIGILTGISGVLLIVLVEPNGFSWIEEFLFKGGNTFLGSREAQLDNLIYRIKDNPWFGNGFGVPKFPYRTWEFSYHEYIVENGNLIFAVLAEGGVIGLGIFCILIRNIVRSCDKWRIGLPMLVAGIMVCMGEMIFFSSNGLGVYDYIIIAMYIFKKEMG